MKQERLSDRLQEAMDLRGLRAADLVDRTGIPKGTVSYYLSGKTEPKADRLYIIAKALNVSEAWLLGYDVAMTRTDDQKKNDALADVVVRMRNEEAFYSAVMALNELSSGELDGVVQMLKAFQK